MKRRQKVAVKQKASPLTPSSKFKASAFSGTDLAEAEWV